MCQNKSIAVIGAGTMGVGIAIQYALFGHPVVLYSRGEETLHRARTVIDESCSLMAQEQFTPIESISHVNQLIRSTTCLEEAVSDAWYVVESITEKAEEKRALYHRLDDLLDESVLISSNTSYLNIFELMPQRRQSHTAIVHWFAPAHIMPLVEIVRGPETSQETIDRLIRLHDDCGKTTVYMDRYVPGFLVNRLQSAMTREVLFLLKNNYCTPEAIDLAVKSSLMPRGMLLGLIQRMDFAGLNMVANGVQNQTFHPAPAPDSDNPLFSHVDAGEYGVKTGSGFYDYSHVSFEEVIRHRDAQLIRSVRLAREFMADPLHNQTFEK